MQVGSRGIKRVKPIQKARTILHLYSYPTFKIINMTLYISTYAGLTDKLTYNGFSYLLLPSILNETKQKNVITSSFPTSCYPINQIEKGEWRPSYHFFFLAITFSLPPILDYI